MSQNNIQDCDDYLQIFQQFFDRVDDCCEISLSPCSTLNLTDNNGNFNKTISETNNKNTNNKLISTSNNNEILETIKFPKTDNTHKTRHNYTLDLNKVSKCADQDRNNNNKKINHSNTHDQINAQINSEQLIRKLSCQLMRRRMLKRQNGFNHEDEDRCVDDKDVSEVINANGNRDERTSTDNINSMRKKHKKGAKRRTSVPLQPINNNKQKENKKSQSFKHPFNDYCYYINTNPLAKPLKKTNSDNKQRRPSFEQHEQHEDPAQKKLQLLRRMQDLDCTVVRTFITSSKGLVNRGDSFRKKQLPQVTPDVVIGCLPQLQGDEHSLMGTKHSIDLLSNNNLTSKQHSNNNSTSKLHSNIPLTSKQQQNPNNFNKASPQIFNNKQQQHSNEMFNVMVLGDHAVGKTSLLQQFVTSEFMASADPIFDKEFEKRVSVQVDGLESTLSFVDLPSHLQKQKGLSYNDTEAFLVCYSITDRQSFEYAIEVLQNIRQRSDAALILVANKSDLVRSRKVSFEESRAVCQKYNCKIVEVSAAFNHRVDELLVGLVHQIRLNPTRQRAKSVPNTTDSTLSTNSLLSTKAPLSAGCFRGAKAFFTEFIMAFRKTKSCDNLWTL